MTTLFKHLAIGDKFYVQSSPHTWIKLSYRRAIIQDKNMIPAPFSPEECILPEQSPPPNEEQSK